MSTAVGDEGGFAPALKSTRQALDIIMSSIHASGLSAGKDIFIALDCAATEYFDGTHYKLVGEDLILTPTQKVDFLENFKSSEISNKEIRPLESSFLQLFFRLSIWRQEGKKIAVGRGYVSMGLLF